MQQLGGGNRLKAMIGAKGFVATHSGLTFSWPARGNKPNKIRITLDPSDTYSVEFFHIRGTAVTTVKELEGVYADSLIELFENTTGLALRIK